MRKPAHGYTNQTVGEAGFVSKTYQGPDAGGRRDRERRMPGRLRGVLPVPEADDVPGVAPLELRLRFLPGEHGQELIEQGHADEVLRAWDSADGVRQWERRAEATAGWTE